MVDWKIVDKDGDEIMTAKSVSLYAEMHQTTPRLFAQKEARLLSSDNESEAFAVRAA